jgi:glutamate carboxypeptidase
MGLNALEQRLADRLAGQGEALLQDLHRHVAIPTGGNHRPGLEAYRDLLVARLADLGAEIDRIPGDSRPAWVDLPGQPPSAGLEPHPIVVARRAGSGPRVLIAGHLDTVHDPEGPFRDVTVAEDGRTATGPGVVDMKGGILVGVAALEALAAEGVDLAWTFMLNADEETGSFQSAARLGEQARVHDVGIALEPALADGSLAIERMGSGQFKVEVTGRSAHVGRAFAEGVSAVTALGCILVELAAMADPGNGMIVSVGPLVGGPVTNAVPDHAACWGNVRYATPEAGERLAAMIDGLATAPDAMPRVVVNRFWNRPAKPQTPAVRALAETARGAAEDLGQALPFASTGGVCDGNILQAAGLPTIDTLGVRGGNLHRPDEWIEIASLVERSQLLAVLLARVARGERSGKDTGV